MVCYSRASKDRQRTRRRRKSRSTAAEVLFALKGNGERQSKDDNLQHGNLHFGVIPGRLFLRYSSDGDVTTVTKVAYGPMIEMICFVLGSTINT